MKVLPKKQVKKGETPEDPEAGEARATITTETTTENSLAPGGSAWGDDREGQEGADDPADIVVPMFKVINPGSNFAGKEGYALGNWTYDKFDVGDVFDVIFVSKFTRWQEEVDQDDDVRPKQFENKARAEAALARGVIEQVERCVEWGVLVAFPMNSPLGQLKTRIVDPESPDPDTPRVFLPARLYTQQSSKSQWRGVTRALATYRSSVPGFDSDMASKILHLTTGNFPARQKTYYHADLGPPMDIGSGLRRAITKKYGY
jgi:hypothetical protein